DVDLVDYDGDDEENPEEDPEEDPKEDPEEEPEPNNGLENGGVNEGVNNEDMEDEDVEIELDDDAELGTCQTKIGLLKSKNKIWEKEREIPNHDLGNVEHVLGDVLERLKVLESEEHATSKKKLVEAEMKLELARMGRDMVERRLHASYGWDKWFYIEMVRIEAVPKPPSDDEGTERPRKKSKKSSFDGTEGPSEPRGPPRSCHQRAGGAGAGDARAGGAGASGAKAGGAGAGGARAGGAGPAAPEITGCTYVTFMKCDP
ncbi:hypothetical protein Tco_0736784, partial [Tanacetum coccineum]